MKKRISLLLLFLISVLVLALTACDADTDDGTDTGDGDETTGTTTTTSHTHTYKQEWSCNDGFHWHESDCGHDVKSGYSAHAFDSGVTTVTPTKSTDGNIRYTCSDCGYAKDETIHSFENGVCTACGATPDVDYIYGFTLLPDGTYAVSAKHTEGLTQLTVPAEYNGVAVTAVAARGFSNLKGIVKIILPEGITSIGNEAFYNCSYYLKFVIIPGSVKTVGKKIFTKSDYVSIAYGGEEIPLSWKINWTGLASPRIYCKDSWKVSDDGENIYCFGEWTTVTAATCTSKGLEKRTDYSNSSVYEEREIPCLTEVITTRNARAATCEHIGWNEYSECEYCHRIIGRTIIPKTDHNYENGECTVCHKGGEDSRNLDTDTTKPGTISGIGSCTDTSLVIPAQIDGVDVTVIGEKAFYNNSQIVKVYISEGITEIGVSAFANCENLEEIYIPKTVTRILGNAFVNCTKLKKIVYNAEDAYTTGGVFVGSAPDGVEIVIGEDCKKIPKDMFGTPTTTMVSDPEEYYRHGIFTIKSITFSGYSVCESIGEHAFGTKMLDTFICIPSSVKSIGYGAFNSGEFNSRFVGYHSGAIILVPFDSGDTAAFADYKPGWNMSYTQQSVSPYSSFSHAVVYNATGKYGVTEDGIYYAITKDGSVTVCGCTDDCDRLIIPDEIDGKKVTVIAHSAFEYQNVHSEIRIPKYVKSIGTNAFYYNSGVEKVRFDAVECKTVQDNRYTVFGKINMTGNTLADVIIGKDVTVIPYSFLNCRNGTRNIGKIIFEKGSVCHTIEGFAFASLNAEYVVIPKSVLIIKGYAFEYDYVRTLGKIYYEGSTDDFDDIAMGSISGTAFSHASIYLYNDGEVTENGNYWYYDEAGNIKEKQPERFTANVKYTLSSDGTYYIAAGFTDEASRDSATSLIISPTYLGKPVKEIIKGTYGYGSGLTNIEIPDSITHIANSCFNNTSFYTDDENYENGVLYLGKFVLRVKSGTVGEITVKYGTIGIADSAFAGIAATKVTLPESLEYINENAFYECKASEINIPGSVKEIGSRAFYNAINLKKLIIPEGVTEFDAETVYNCRALEELVLPDTLTSVSGTFYRLYALKTLIIPDSVTSFSASFDGLSAVENLELPSSVRSYKRGFLKGFTSLKTLRLPIADYQDNKGLLYCLFYGSYDGNKIYQNMGVSVSVYVPANLEKITVSSGNIGNYFSKITTLKEVVLESGVTKIGSYAFDGCTSLEKITISDGVEKIDTMAFNGCTALKSISIPASVTVISSMALNGSSINEIHFGGTLEQWKTLNETAKISISDDGISLYIDGVKVDPSTLQ